MEKMISYCGLVCCECPAYLAKVKDDNEKRIMTARAWSSETYILEPEDINCDGCKTAGGELFKYCAECFIRQCASKRGVENCGTCPEYGCERIKFHIDRSPEAKEILDEFNRNR